jgi:hypothetical protein
MRLLVCCLGVALVVAPLPAQTPKAEDAARAEKAVQDLLAKHRATGARVERIKDESISKVLPKEQFFAVLFPQFPVAREAPAPFKPSNVVAVSPDAKVRILSNPKELGTYLNSTGLTASDEAAMKQAVRAFLRLNQQFHQDGFYQFKLVNESLAVTKEGDNRKVSGRVTVVRGGNGEITTTLVFDASGRLTSWKEQSKLIRGPRPRCHATKLLDPDPVVRTIVEEDLLYMGKAALPYLEEQRAKASPELRQAIDRVRERILERK